MINIDTLVNKKYKSFSAFYEEYNKRLEKIKHLESILYPEEILTENEMSLEELVELYELVKQNIKWNEETKSYDYESIRNKLGFAFPKLRKYLESKAAIDSLNDNLNDLMVYGINLNYDEHPHVYIPTTTGLKCMVTGEDIVGFKTPEEIEFIHEAALKQHLLIKEYKNDDFNTVQGLLATYELDSDCVREYLNPDDIYFIIDFINRKLIGKHAMKDLIENNSFKGVVQKNKRQK